MKVFVTGATGYIGTAVVAELTQAGHQVVGLARTDQGEARLRAAGARVRRGTLADLSVLKEEAGAADGVIHLAFVHTFPAFLLSAIQTDVKAINALGSALEGTGKPLVAAGGVAGLRPGEILTEDFVPDYRKVPRKSEQTVLDWAARGVRASVVRLSPTVHGPDDHGFVSWVVAAARKKRNSVFVGDGRQRWAAVHRLDAARLFRLALERGKAGGIFHGVAEEGVPFGDVAEAVGRGLGVPTKSRSQWGAFLSMGVVGIIAGIDGPASHALTTEALGWEPSHPTLLQDVTSGAYALPGETW